MLYVDIPWPIIVANPNANYNKYAITLGRVEHQYGPKFNMLVSPEIGEQFGSRIPAGFHLNLTLERTRSARGPRLISRLDDRLFLILSSRLTHHADYVGNIRIPRSQQSQIITRAKPHPDSGRWETLVIQAQSGESYYVNWNCLDGSEGTNSFYHIAELDQVYTCPQSGIPDLFYGLGLTPQFTVRDHLDPLVSRLDYHEWRKL